MRGRLTTALAALAFAPMLAHAAAFTNLDFESATVVSNDPVFGFLAWESAAPGWNHGGGSDTGSVYHGLTHAGVTPWYLLVDATSHPEQLLAGSYSLAFASGHESADPSSGWVQSFVSQTGTVPLGSRSLQLLASGALEVYIDGALRPLHALGGDLFAVDVTGLAGTDVELKLLNASNAMHDALVIDDIRFSAAAVPEPASALLLAGGAAALWLLRRRAPMPV